ncbi:MAG: exodeoxyribonuclease III [Planctomycetota bacterium]|jgi:exodeoxyribonuclease-3
MLIATWNVNSIRVRMPRLTAWLEERRPDVLCVQETKVQDPDFPHEPLEALGYRAEAFGQKTYNGVAILSRHPMTEVTRGLPGDEPEEQKRVIEATVEGVRVVNLYVPNGKAPGTDAYEMKLDWLARLRARLDEGLSPDDPVVVLGDMNIAPEDRDVYDPVALAGTIHVSDPERAALRNVMDWGLLDAQRLHTDEAGVYSWWDYRAGMFRRGLGMRIDLVLVSRPLAERCTAVEIDKRARGGEKPSDHAPVLATFT